jgi:hypothetical protein
MNPFSTFADPEAVQAAVERLQDLPSRKYTLEAARERQRAARVAKGLPVFDDDDDDDDVAPAKPSRRSSKERAL